MNRIFTSILFLTSVLTALLAFGTATPSAFANEVVTVSGDGLHSLAITQDIYVNENDALSDIYPWFTIEGLESSGETGHYDASFKESYIRTGELVIDNGSMSEYPYSIDTNLYYENMENPFSPRLDCEYQPLIPSFSSLSNGGYRITLPLELRDPNNIFENAGAYRYRVVKVPGTRTDIVSSQAEYIITLFVKRSEDGLEYDKATFERVSDDAGEETSVKVDASQSQSHQSEMSFLDYSNDQVGVSLGKEVAGEYASTTHAFPFEVSLVFPEYSSQISYPKPATMTLPDGTVTQIDLSQGTWTGTVSLAHGQEVAFNGLPVGTTYSMEETSATDSALISYDVSSRTDVVQHREISSEGEFEDLRSRYLVFSFSNDSPGHVTSLPSSWIEFISPGGTFTFPQVNVPEGTAAVMFIDEENGRFYMPGMSLTADRDMHFVVESIPEEGYSECLLDAATISYYAISQSDPAQKELICTREFPTMMSLSELSERTCLTQSELPASYSARGELLYWEVLEAASNPTSCRPGSTLPFEGNISLMAHFANDVPETRELTINLSFKDFADHGASELSNFSTTYYNESQSASSMRYIVVPEYSGELEQDETFLGWMTPFGEIIEPGMLLRWDKVFNDARRSDEWNTMLEGDAPYILTSEYVAVIGGEDRTVRFYIDEEEKNALMTEELPWLLENKRIDRKTYAEQRRLFSSWQGASSEEKEQTGYDGYIDVVVPNGLLTDSEVPITWTDSWWEPDSGGAALDLPQMIIKDNLAYHLNNGNLI